MIFWYIMGWLHRLYYWIVEFAWYCRGETSHALLVDDEGNQLALTDDHLASGAGTTMLTIFYTKVGTRYRFVPLDAEDRSALDLISAYRTWTAPRQSIFGLMVEWKDHQHYLDPSEFAVVGNCLFTQQFTRWLCKHYLHIVEADKVDITVIDSDMVVRHFTNPLQVTSENWVPLQLKEEGKEESDQSESQETDSQQTESFQQTDSQVADDYSLLSIEEEKEAPLAD